MDQKIEQLMRAAEMGNLQQVDHLLQKLDIDAKDERGMTALCWAVLKQKEDVVEYLLNNGADPNIIYRNGSSSILSSAVVRKNIKIVKLLLEADADPRIPLKDTLKTATGIAERLAMVSTLNTSEEADTMSQIKTMLKEKSEELLIRTSEARKQKFKGKQQRAQFNQQAPKPPRNPKPFKLERRKDNKFKR